MLATKRYRVRNIAGIISTDDIIPAHYKHKFTQASALAAHIFENKFPNFAASINCNDVLICDSTFGIGSSREQAVSALLAADVCAVIAPSFGRIFFRNAWNLGLIAIETKLPPLTEFDELIIELNQGLVISNHLQFHFKPVPQEMLDFLRAGGLLNHVKKKMREADMTKGTNKKDVGSSKKEAFGGLAHAYDKARPTYPEELYRTLLNFFYEDKQNKNIIPVVVDVGCGTGISTRAIYHALNRQAEVYGIEPGAEMFKTAVAATQEPIKYLEAAAEHLPFANDSVDIITAAQAVQWFDRPAFYDEAKRIMKKGAVIALYENNRDWQNSEFLSKYEEFLEEYSIKPDGSKYTRYYRDFPYEHELKEKFSDIATHTFHWQREMSADEFLTLAQSSTQAQRAIKHLGLAKAEELILKIIHAYCKPNDIVEIPYNTKLFLARK